jgi:hypothetical protein
MTINLWNKKALAGIAALALLGSMAPISAVAEDLGPNSVTYTVDLNDGGGGDGVTCPTQSTFTVNPGVSQPRSLGVTEGRVSDGVGRSQSLWYGPEGAQRDYNWESDWTRDDFNEWERNKKRSFAFTPIVVNFDADGCETSTLAGAVYVQRGPVLRAETSRGEFSVAEIRNDEVAGEDGFGTANNVGMANLFGDNANMMGGLSFETPLWGYPLWRTSNVLDPSSRSYGYDDDPVAAGSNAEFRLQPRVDIFGNSPTGVYKVTYDLYLEVEDAGLNSDSCWWFC